MERVFALAAGLLLWCASPPPEDLLFWSAAKKLNWADFKGKHDPSGGLDAFTCSEIAFAPVDNASPDSLILNVTCAFNCNKSSVKTGLKQAILLDHEQGHFDMAEIYARLLRKKITEAKFTRKNAQSLLQTIYKKNLEEFQAEQDLYDRETNHSLAEEKQKQWDKKIADRLKELDQFSRAIVRIKFNA